MGNRSNTWDKPIRPSSLARSDPTPDRPQEGAQAEPREQGKEAKSMVVKVLRSPQHMRKSVAPSPAPLPSTRHELDLKPLSDLESAEAKPETKLLLKANSKFPQGETSIERRAPRTRIKQEARFSKRGSIGPGSRSQSRDSSPAPSITVTEQNAAIRARAIKEAQQSTKDYKAAVSELFAEWEGEPELATVDSFLQLDTDLTKYLGHLFATAPLLAEKDLGLGDVMFCGVHFLWSCRNDASTQNVQLQGTAFEDKDVAYFKHVDNFFNLVSKDLDFANFKHNEIKVGTVVDFRDTEFSRTAIKTLTVLQAIFDRILDKTLFDDF